MEKIELEIDRQTLERVKTLAMLNQSTVSELLTEVMARLAEIQDKKDPLMGLYADLPEVIDEILADAMEKRGYNVANE